MNDTSTPGADLLAAPPLAAPVRPGLCVGIYARYSCDKQEETSLDDQVRRCRELALRHGLIVGEDLIYTDAAQSGLNDERPGYQRLLADWYRGVVEVVLVDEFSRLSRDGVEQARLMKRLEHRPGMRLITADGIDTRDADWQLRLGLQGILAQHETRKLRFRVARGMEGQLERGYMLAAPPFGYDLRREFDAIGNRVGTRWVVNEKEAAIVREVYARRASGESMHQTAAWLNASGVPCSRKARTPSGGFWRPARVKQLLDNTIYRGVFRWHASTTYLAEIRRRGLEPDIQEYARPELRLVSDDVWWRCRDKVISRSGYGGGRYALAGLMTCGCCGGTLCLTAKVKGQSAYCPACTVAKATNGEHDRLTSTVAVDGLRLLLTEALKYFLSEPMLQSFRASLRHLMSGDARQEVEAAQRRLAELQRGQVRLSHLLTQVSDDDPVLAQRYVETREKVRRAQESLAALEAQSASLDERAAQLQLTADPAHLLGRVFDAALPVHEVRSVLAGLFPSIVFVTKHGRYHSVFIIRFSPGVALATATGTERLSTQECEARFALRYRPRHGTQDAHWTVDVLAAPQEVGGQDEPAHPKRGSEGRRLQAES